MSDSEVTCPYCNIDFELDLDDGAYHDQNNEETAECPECEKTMLVNSSITWFREALPADCLNTGKHTWSEWNTYWIGEQEPNIGKYYELKQCQDCNLKEWEYHIKRLDKRPSVRFDKVTGAVNE